jgi:hypothetical protein
MFFIVFHLQYEDLVRYITLMEKGGGHVLELWRIQGIDV